MFVRRELQFSGAGVSIFEEHYCNEPIHGDAAGLVGEPDVVITSEVNSCKFCSFPVYADIVVLLKILEEM